MIAFSQLADSIVLPVVEVEAPALRSNLTGTRNEQWDSKKLASLSGNNLGELLQQESGVFIKSYGIGSSATVAVRGGSAGHTAVLWNGLPLQSPMLGLLDFSLMPVSFLDKVDLQYGGNSSAWGSGAIGGVIALDNKLKKETTSVEINSSAGSFGLLNNQLKAQYNFGKWTGVTRLFQKSADNNFTYQIREDLPIVEQTNAAFEQQGILQELYYLPKGNQELSIRFWGQKTDRQIPPTSAQTRSLASQKDESLRGSIHWKSIQDKWIWNAKSGLFRESIHYQDCLLYTSPSPRDATLSRMPSSA